MEEKLQLVNIRIQVKIKENNMNIKKYQVINWFPEWQKFGLWKNPGYMSKIYKWQFYIAFWEIRKFV